MIFTHTNIYTRMGISSTLTYYNFTWFDNLTTKTRFGGQIVKPGEIIIRQRGTNTHPGVNVGMGKDHTLFATSAGQVQFTYKGIKQKKTVNVISQ